MKQGKISAATVTVALIGVFLCGVGVAFNNCAGLGNDSIGILYDGIRNAMGLTAEQLGMVSNVINISLLLLMLVIGRKYVSVGTMIYLIPYGTCVSIGITLYNMLAMSDAMPVRIIFAVCGCLLICIGVALFITADIGVDPMTGLVLVLVDTVKKEYRLVKIGFDITMIIIGFLLGGKAGVVTLVTGVLVGPCIQFFNQTFIKLLVKQN